MSIFYLINDFCYLVVRNGAIGSSVWTYCAYVIWKPCASVDIRKYGQSIYSCCGCFSFFFSILSCYVLSREGIRQTVFFCCRQHLTFLILTGPSSSTMAPSSSTMAPSYMLGISSLVSTLDLVCNTYLSVQAGLIRVIKIMKEVKLVYMIFILL